ncbi:uncharacterized protein DS421_20g688980 [Arachis hypogaea]|nr:uncharacterized protein DS421_20g688980 [Arachis hypogaea]
MVKRDKGKEIMTGEQYNFGERMIVQRPRRGRRNQKEEEARNKPKISKVKGKEDYTETNSRYGVLTIEEPEQTINEERQDKYNDRTNKKPEQQQKENNKGVNNKHLKGKSNKETSKTNKNQQTK